MSKPWYDGMTNDEIEGAIRLGLAPGSTVPGGVVEVPHGFLGPHRLRLRDVDVRLQDPQPQPQQPVQQSAWTATKEDAAKVASEIADEMREHSSWRVPNGISKHQAEQIRGFDDWMCRLHESIRAPMREAIARGLDDLAKSLDEPGNENNLLARIPIATLRDAADRVRAGEWEAELPFRVPATTTTPTTAPEP